MSIWGLNMVRVIRGCLAANVVPVTWNLLFTTVLVILHPETALVIGVGVGGFIFVVVSIFLDGLADDDDESLSRVMAIVVKASGTLWLAGFIVGVTGDIWVAGVALVGYPSAWACLWLIGRINQK